MRIAPETCGQVHRHTIFTTFRGEFGDCWAAASFFAARASKQDVFVSRQDSRISTILPLLEFEGAIGQTADRADTAIMARQDEKAFAVDRGYVPRQIVPWRTVMALPYVPTRSRWKAAKRRQIVYQLVPREDGRTSCQAGEIEFFMKRLELEGITAIPLGLPKSVEQIVEDASESSFFVGIDSGMSHLCHSVGIPSILIRNRLPLGYLQVTHAGKTFDEYSTLPDFVVQIDTYIRTFIGEKSG
jgi:hypothetical protein